MQPRFAGTLQESANAHRDGVVLDDKTFGVDVVDRDHG